MLAPNGLTIEEVERCASYRNDYKLHALVDILIEKECITKEEMNTKYVELINSISYATENESEKFKKELIKPLYPAE